MSLQEKFIAVLEKHKGILYKIANAYCKTSEDRNDLVQEMIFQLWKSFDKYDSQYQYSTWVYRIALNVAISYYQKSRKKIDSLTIEQSFFNIKEESNDTEKEEQLSLLHQCIKELKEIDRAIILLYLEEKNHKEIAEIMGMSESNVGTKIGRIKQHLKQKFESRYEP
jgi:RNA polymerase sigma factor (sigma-70 family)